MDKIEQLKSGSMHDPHSFLGLHPAEEGLSVIRLWRPGALEVFLEVNGKTVQAKQVDDRGLFEYIMQVGNNRTDYKIFHTSGMLAQDPYTHMPTVGEVDQYLFAKGSHYRIYEILGAHPTFHQGCHGVKFAVWAPSAKGVSLVADFNHWDGRVNPMRSMGHSGIWELFVPGLSEGVKYKYEIRTPTNQIRIKADPYAFSSELRPLTGSVVAQVDGFQWQDQEWMRRRTDERDWAKPLNIYEVHLGSWRKRGENFLKYPELARELVSYCHEMGFTHVQLMPVSEHPLDESWGYQISGYYAVTSRHGTPREFQEFVDILHSNGLGVIIDWVPGHFPSDDFSLARFDGSCLYEHADWRQGYHPHWNTYIFNYGRHEVVNFLIGNALFWFEKMHVDGLRVDAVASMLYLDYGRNEGEWIPNRYGGKENLEAIEFLKHLNSVVHERHPGVLMIAEESTSFTGVTHPLSQGGLGFDLKWNMGWMNDTLVYFHKDPLYRHYHHDHLTFGLIYAFSEKFILVLSHDEVVHGKGSLLSKMPGDYWQKFANLRLLYSYMICQPGKKLLFMGGEFGQWNEWHCKSEIEWFLLQFPQHHALQKLVKDINHFYLSHNILWERDFDYTGFEWVDFSDRQNSVISYLRKSHEGVLLCVHNCTPSYHPNYYLNLRSVKTVKEVFNTDATWYGGSGKMMNYGDIIRSHDGHSQGVVLQLAPLATQIFEIEWE